MQHAVFKPCVVAPGLGFVMQGATLVRPSGHPAASGGPGGRRRHVRRSPVRIVARTRPPAHAAVTGAPRR